MFDLVGGVLDGIRTVFSSPYLLGIVGYMLFYTVTATILYFQQAEIVDVSLMDEPGFSHVTFPSALSLTD